MENTHEQELQKNIIHIMEQIENMEGMIQELLQTKQEIEKQILEQETENNIEKK